MTNSLCNDEQTQAICGAFLMVAFADARFDSLEEGRFLTSVVNDASLKNIETAALESCYNTLVEAFQDNYASTAASVLSTIKSSRTDKNIAAAVTLSARRAIVADETILPQEEAALDAIAGALGLEKGAV